LLAGTARINVRVQGVSLEDALKKCLENEPLGYTIVDSTVVLSPAPLLPAQIRGRVLTSGGDPIAGASIQIKGTRKGVTTDRNGAFTIEATRENTLVFSSVGYETQEIKVGEQKEIIVTLVEAKKALSDLVVVGYGKQSRKALTSSISTVTGEDMNKGAITDVGQLLQGKVPGLNITANGDPNQTSAVILRGASTINSSQSPFYVIDGVPGADISLIAPADIVSIDVLKDAAATAIYGNRASNGVIMVTTRRGKSGDMQVAYSGYAGLEKVSNNLKVMTAAQLRAFLSKNGEALSPADDKGASTNWQKAIEKNAAYSQSHNIALSGGTDHSDYIASLNYAYKDGILQSSSLQRIIARLAVDQSAIDDKVKLGLNFTYSSSNAQDIPYRSVTLLQSALYLPVSPVKNADGTYFEDFSNSNYYNPVAMTNNSTLNTKYNNLVGNFTGQVKLPFGLLYNMDLSYQSYGTEQGQYLDSYYTGKYTNMYNNPNPGLSGHTQQIFGSGGQATRSSYTNTSTLFENYLTWDRHFGAHAINAVAGYSWQSFVNGDGFNVTTANFPVDNISYNNLALSNPYALGSFQVNFGADGIYNQTRLISDFGRITYNYKEKYLLQGSVRRDGSSVFGADHQWGYFPSVGAGWRISQEKFMQKQHLFNELKLRGSYGVTGNATGFSAYTAQSISGSLGTYYYDGVSTSALGPTQQANPALQWEKTATADIGLDFSLLHGRWSGAVDLYNKNTTNMIYSYKVDPILVPSGSITANGGSMNNKGIELTLNATPVSSGDFRWVTGLNLAHNVNKITSLSNPLFTGGDSVLLADPEGAGQSGSTLEILKSGRPLGQFFSLEYAGKNASGVSQYLSSTGALTTTPNEGVDYHYLGNAQPKLLLGWSNSFHYRNLDLNIFLRGTFGNKVFNATRADLFRPATAQYDNILQDAAGESVKDYNAYLYSSRFIENGSYLRFDNATLGYTLRKLGPYVKSVRLYVTGNNLFVITGYKGIDPEINQGGLAPGVDYNNFYPKTRTFLLGANVSF
jgi:iron complex outermembrane receptor protein